jgi:hypothetical protein
MQWRGRGWGSRETRGWWNGWDEATAGPGGQRQGAGERGSAAEALTSETQPAVGEGGQSGARVGRPRENAKWAGPG